MKMPAALRVRFLRPAWPDCSLLGVTRLNGVPAQGESSAPPWSKASRHDAWAVRRSLQDRAGRVSSRSNFSRSSDATVQARRFAVGHAINLLKGLGLDSKRCCSLFILDPRIYILLAAPPFIFIYCTVRPSRSTPRHRPPTQTEWPPL